MCSGISLWSPLVILMRHIVVDSPNIDYNGYCHYMDRELTWNRIQHFIRNINQYLFLLWSLMHTPTIIKLYFRYSRINMSPHPHKWMSTHNEIRRIIREIIKYCLWTNEPQKQKKCRRMKQHLTWWITIKFIINCNHNKISEYITNNKWLMTIVNKL